MFTIEIEHIIKINDNFRPTENRTQSMKEVSQLTVLLLPWTTVYFILIEQLASKSSMKLINKVFYKSLWYLCFLFKKID